jgi:hypothetical protein
MSAVAEDVRLLVTLGKILDRKFPKYGTIRGLLIGALLKVRDKRGRLVPLRPNRAQREFERRHGAHHIVLKARQLGITTWVAARFFIDTITHPGTVTVQVAHDQSSAEEIFRIVHRFLENLPERLRMGALKTSRANVRQLAFARLDSEYRVETAADPNAGRGLTIRNLHCSEVARWPRDAAGTLGSLRAAVPPDGEIVLESTPNGAGGCFYDEWQRAEETGYERHFFPWWYGKEYAVDCLRSTADGANVDRRPSTVDELSAEERELMAQHGLTAAQIAFRRRLRADFRGLAAQEYAEDAVSCFLASGECVFDVEAIERRLRDLAPPAETHDNRRLQIWYPPQPGMEYLVGVDTASGGTDGDYACAEVIDRRRGRQCAELHGHFSIRELAAHVAELGHRYNDALLVVERNNQGTAVLVHLVDLLKYPEIYCEKSEAGMVTTAITRPKMLEWLAVTVAREAALFSGERLLQECRAFVRHANGSPSAASGAHDDCVMAMAFAQWARWEQMARRGTTPQWASVSI